MSRINQSRIARNIVSLYAVHFAGVLLPLISVPYVARVLQPTEWGIIAFAQACAGYLSLIVGFGFNASATREVARVRDRNDSTSKIVAGVMGAKLMLTACAIVMALAAFL